MLGNSRCSTCQCVNEGEGMVTDQILEAVSQWLLSGRQHCRCGGKVPWQGTRAVWHWIPLCKKMCKLIPICWCTLSVRQSKLEHEGIKRFYVHFMFQQNPIQAIIFSCHCALQAANILCSSIWIYLSVTLISCIHSS